MRIYCYFISLCFVLLDPSYLIWNDTFQVGFQKSFCCALEHCRIVVGSIHHLCRLRSLILQPRLRLLFTNLSTANPSDQVSRSQVPRAIFSPPFQAALSYCTLSLGRLDDLQLPLRLVDTDAIFFFEVFCNQDIQSRQDFCSTSSNNTKLIMISRDKQSRVKTQDNQDQFNNSMSKELSKVSCKVAERIRNIRFI